MTIYMLCRRSLLLGERYRLWHVPGRAGERAVCRLCEEEAEASGWRSLDRPPELQKLNVIWRARRVA